MSSKPLKRPPLPSFSGVLLVLLTLTYPFLVYWGLSRFDVRILALVLLVLFLLRLVTANRANVSPIRHAWLLAVAAIFLCGMVLAANDGRFFLFYPVVVNAVMLAGFAWTLREPPPMIERFARMREPDLPPVAIAYCRKVTWVWCGFFGFNGTVALITALLDDRRPWMLYNGLVSYLLIGLLAGGEFLVRNRLRKRHERDNAS